MQASIDGTWAEAGREPDLSAEQRSRGVFTTVGVTRGCPLFLADHIARLRHDAAVKALEPPDTTTIAKAVHDGLQRNALREGVVKVIVTVRDDSASEPSGLRVFFEPPRDEPQWVNWLLTELPIDSDRSIKSLHRDHWQAGQLRAKRAGCFDVLAMAEGRLLETSICNLFVVIDQQLVTPPADGSILPGIGRAHMLAAAAPLPAVERTLSIEELAAADTLFGINSVRGILPVRRILWEDGSKLWETGAKAEGVLELQREYWNRLVRREIAGIDGALSTACP